MRVLDRQDGSRTVVAVRSTKEESMPRAKPHIAIEPRPDGRWAVQKNGTKRASRVLDRKADAEKIGRAQAKREGAELVVKGADGRIQRRDSHGSDPPSSKG